MGRNRLKGCRGGVFIDAQWPEDKAEAFSMALPPVERSGCTFERSVYWLTNVPRVYN